MIKKILFVLIVLIISINLACSNTATTNSASNKAVVSNSSAGNLPEGLSGNQMTFSNNSMQGIPDPKSINANISKGVNSTPGIPDTTQTGKTPQPKNTPRIAGIPDEETLRKEMTTPADRSVMNKNPPETDSNTNNHPTSKPRATRKP